MRTTALALVAAAFLSACASTPVADTAKAPAGIPQVSVAALLARAGEFDGRPVRVIGVARFGPAGEARSALYASSDDERRSTSSFITIASFDRDWSPPPGGLARLTGESVAIEAVFRAKPLNRIPERPGSVVVCVGDCQTSGVLEDVTRVSPLAR